jgi:hypothetical protein
VLANDGAAKTLNLRGLQRIAEHDCARLLPIQEAVLQDPSKASGLAKSITCVQALWFCSQCVARLSQNMAISLLELNTFSHCISAFFIYVFWWHKPYDVTTHTYINMSGLPGSLRTDLMQHCTSNRSKNMAREIWDPYDWMSEVFRGPLTVALASFIYGTMHLLAWQYHFPTDAERLVWRCASVMTASSGLITFLTLFRRSKWDCFWLPLITCLFGFVAIAARSFLVFESFKALPNSPASIYEVPRWSAYVPHI